MIVQEIRSPMDDLGAVELLAIYVKSQTYDLGVKFVTPPGLTQQLAVMHRVSDTRVLPHYHKQVLRTVQWTQETLIVKSGRAVVTLYDNQQRPIRDITIEPGDVLLLVAGGHSLYFPVACELIEVKQGPHGVDDKVMFTPKDVEV